MNEDPSTTGSDRAERNERDEGVEPRSEASTPSSRSMWSTPIGWWFAFDGWRRATIPDEEYVLA